MREPTHQHRLEAGLNLSQSFAGLDSVDPRHHEVNKREIEILFLNQAESRGPVTCIRQDVLRWTEHEVEQVPDQIVVIHDKNLLLYYRRKVVGVRFTHGSSFIKSCVGMRSFVCSAGDLGISGFLSPELLRPLC